MTFLLSVVNGKKCRKKQKQHKNHIKPKKKPQKIENKSVEFVVIVWENIFVKDCQQTSVKELKEHEEIKTY